MPGRADRAARVPALGLALVAGLSGCGTFQAPEVVRAPAVRSIPEFECPDWPSVSGVALDRGFELEAERRERITKGEDAHGLCAGAYRRLRERAEDWIR